MVKRGFAVLVSVLIAAVTVASCSSAGTKSTVGIVGDSITYFSEPAIHQTLTGWHYEIQAERGKTIADMTPLLVSNILHGPGGPTRAIVVNLGTNDVLYGNRHWLSDWDTLMADTSHTSCLVLFTISEVLNNFIRFGGPTPAQINSVIEGDHDADPTRVHIIDWSAAVHAMQCLAAKH